MAINDVMHGVFSLIRKKEEFFRTFSSSYNQKLKESKKHLQQELDSRKELETKAELNKEQSLDKVVRRADKVEKSEKPASEERKSYTRETLRAEDEEKKSADWRGMQLDFSA